MRELRALRSLAKAMGVHTRYTDGLGRRVRVTPETLLRVCTALGVPVTRPADAADALRAHRAAKKTGALAPVLVAWDGVLPPVAISGRGSVQAEMLREDGTVAQLEIHRRKLRLPHPLPFGYHRLTVHASGGTQTCTVIAAPVQAFRRPGAHRS
ncbi:MAG: hypothetical protein OEO17_11810, partial [Gemmatimonadota bacterium]|nr:hypothetical protein [Gemmatimonadota bacterium]